MQQVTRRGLVQASLCTAAIALGGLPLSLNFDEPRARPVADLKWAEKQRLSKFIAKTYRQPLDLVQRIVDAAFAQAQTVDLSPYLVLAIIAKESSFIPSAMSSYGALGLMQVVPRHHPQAVGKIDHPEGLYHPESNIATGTHILARYLRSAKGNLSVALRRYSGGARQYETRVAQYWTQFAAVATTRTQA